MSNKENNLTIELVHFWKGKSLPEWFGLDPKKMTKKQKIEYNTVQDELKEFHRQWESNYKTNRK